MNILMSIPEIRGVNNFIRNCLIETAVDSAPQASSKVNLLMTILTEVILRP